MAEDFRLKVSAREKLRKSVKEEPEIDIHELITGHLLSDAALKEEYDYSEFTPEILQKELRRVERIFVSFNREIQNWQRIIADPANSAVTRKNFERKVREYQTLAPIMQARIEELKERVGKVESVQ